MFILTGICWAWRIDAVSEKHIRSSEIMVVFAVPFASLNAGLLLLADLPPTAGHGVGGILAHSGSAGDSVHRGFCGKPDPNRLLRRHAAATSSAVDQAWPRFVCDP